MSQEVDADSLGDEFKGYRFQITGGNDKQGFPMMQGVLCADRVRLLLKKGVPPSLWISLMPNNLQVASATDSAVLVR